MMAAAAVVVAMLAFGAAIFLVTPLIARRDLFFGVTVAPSFPLEPAGRAIMRRYRLEVMLHAVIAAGLAVAGIWVTRMGPAQPLAVFWLLGGSGVAFARAHRAVLPSSAFSTAGGIREAELTPRGSLPGGMLLWAGPFLLLGAGVVWAAARWSEIPEQFPTHWGLDGQPNGWSGRTVLGVFGPAIMGAMACALTLGIAYSVLHMSRPLRVSGEEGRQEDRVRRANLLMVLGSQYLIAIMCGWLTTTLPFSVSPRVVIAGVVGAAASVAVATVLIARMRRNVPIGGSLGDMTPDECWKWGMFYYNPADPALWVDKRVGLGWTLNFGHTGAWIIMGGIVALPMLVALLPLLPGTRR